MQNEYIPADEIAGFIDSLGLEPERSFKVGVAEAAKSLSYHLERAERNGDAAEYRKLSAQVDRLEAKSAAGPFNPGSIRLAMGDGGSAMPGNTTLDNVLANDAGNAAPKYYGKQLKKNMHAPLLEGFGNAELKSLFEAGSNRQSVRVQTKAPSDLTGQLAPYQFPRTLGPIHEGRLLDYLPTNPTTAPVISYLQHSSTTGSAETVAAGAAKPEIEFVTQQKLASVSKLAAWTSTTHEALQDFADWSNYVPSELQRQLIDAENQQILNGDGTGTNILGLLNVTGIITATYAPTSGLPTLPDIFGTTIAAMRTGAALATCDLIVIHPETFWAVKLAKSTLNTYLDQSDTLTAPADMLWGIPAVQSTAMAAGTALLLDTTKFGRAWIREAMNIQVDPYSGSTTNTLKWVAETRISLTVERPAAIAKITGLS